MLQAWEHTPILVENAGADIVAGIWPMTKIALNNFAGPMKELVVLAVEVFAFGGPRKFEDDKERR